MNNKEFEIEPPIDVKHMNIIEKMYAITSELGVVKKDIDVSISKTKSYKAVSERDVKDELKPLLKKYRVYAHPITRELVDKDVLITQTDYGERQSLFYHYKNVMRFCNVDDKDDFIDVVTYSTGIDSGDKADGKAMTYGDKYAYMTAFMISTGDDPDEEKSEQYDIKITAGQIKRIKELFSEDKIQMMLEHFNVKDISELSGKTASEVIKNKEKKNEQSSS